LNNARIMRGRVPIVTCQGCTRKEKSEHIKRYS
jgi:hypothetical protein